MDPSGPSDRDLRQVSLTWGKRVTYPSDAALSRKHPASMLFDSFKDMSDSSLSDPALSDAEIENALRNAVKKRYQTDPEQLTIKRIRTDVEQHLGLDDSFFKSDVVWNTRSKEVIQSQVDAQEAQSAPPSSQPAKSSPPKTKNQSSKTKKVTKGQKRPAAHDEAPKKRKKKDDSSRDNSINEVKQLLGENLERPGSTSSSPLPDVDGAKANQGAGTDHAEKLTNGAKEQASESEMSVLLDEDPKPKKKARKASSEKPKSKKKESSKSAKAPQQQSSDADAEEMKRLQGWLIKCGIRKMWYKELAPYDSAKAKIGHLKEMLAEAGMTGRYSQEKATQIRDARELKADLDAVQAGNKQWGKAESDEDTSGRPNQRLARGLQELDFLKDDDSEDEGGS